MMNMRTIMPALQKAQPAPVGAQGVQFLGVELPRQERKTRVVKDATIDEMAKEIVEWFKA
jgi:electron transfer flavoprotein beta subunit